MRVVAYSSNFYTLQCHVENGAKEKIENIEYIYRYIYQYILRMQIRSNFSIIWSEFVHFF